MYKAKYSACFSAIQIPEPTDLLCCYPCFSFFMKNLIFMYTKPDKCNLKVSLHHRANLQIFNTQWRYHMLISSVSLVIYINTKSGTVFPVFNMLFFHIFPSSFFVVFITWRLYNLVFAVLLLPITRNSEVHMSVAFNGTIQIQITQKSVSWFKSCNETGHTGSWKRANFEKTMLPACMPQLVTSETIGQFTCSLVQSLCYWMVIQYHTS